MVLRLTPVLVCLDKGVCCSNLLELFLTGKRKLLNCSVWCSYCSTKFLLSIVDAFSNLKLFENPHMITED